MGHPSAPGDQTARYGTVLTPAEFEAATGVRITRVGLSGADGIVDVRYQVLDPDKAVVVHDKENPPALVGKSGRVFGRSWHSSHTRRKQPRAGGTYYFLLLNERGGLHHGSTVSVKVGRALLPNVTVQRGRGRPVTSRRHVRTLVALVAVLAITAPLAAHSGLVTSTPRPGAVLRQSPRRVTLKFARELDVRKSTFELRGPAGRRIVGRVDLNDLDRASMSARIRTRLPVGVYLVDWRAVDAVDGEATAGSFRFRIRRS